MTREALYVAASRARHENHLYISLDEPVDVDASHGSDEYLTARDVLTAALNNLGADLSAHETRRAAERGVATPANRIDPLEGQARRQRLSPSSRGAYPDQFGFGDVRPLLDHDRSL